MSTSDQFFLPRRVQKIEIWLNEKTLVIKYFDVWVISESIEKFYKIALWSERWRSCTVELTPVLLKLVNKLSNSDYELGVIQVGSAIVDFRLKDSKTDVINSLWEILFNKLQLKSHTTM